MHVILAHGASGDAASMRGHVDGLAALGIPASSIDLPLRRADSAVTAYREAALRIAGAQHDGGGEPRLVVGGQSYGGRVASLLAAEDGPRAWAGLVCFSYPLHRPGRPEWQERTAHWHQLRLPVLLLSGESDPFARLDLLRRACAERLPQARLVTYPGVGHGLRPVLDAALSEVAHFVRELSGHVAPSA